MKPNRNQKKNVLFLIAFSFILFILLIFPNATGAKEMNMLAVFEIDEFAQYPHLIRMLTRGETLYQSIRNFVVYLHYFYGYPFYFFSALAALPIRLLFGENWVNHTQSILTILRQMVTVLPMLISIGFWLYMTKAFFSVFKTILGFLLLVSIPAVFENFFWWHPDSLAFLFVTLTFFFLIRDDLRFKRNFWFAAITAGLALGTKHLGEFFILTIPIYLLYAVLLRKISWKKLIVLATGFVVLMLTAVIISNPLLLLPIERGEVIRYQLIQWKETTQGSLVAHQSLTIPEFIRFLSKYAVLLPVGIISIAVLVLGLRNDKTRLFYLLLISFLVPYGLVIFGGSSLRPNYLIPFFIPLLASMLLYLPELKWINLKNSLLPAFVLFFLIIQIIWFIPKNIQVYQNTLTREDTSPSIQFYDEFREKIPPQTHRVFRDWQIYIPETVPYEIYYDWNNASYPFIDSLQPDLIILEQSRIQLFSKQDADIELSENVNGEEWYVFYSDANNNQVKGYSLLYADNFAKAFVRNPNH